MLKSVSVTEEAETSELQSSANGENVDNSALQSSANSDIINNIQNIVEGKNNVIQGTNAPSVREIREKHFKKTADNDKTDIRETVEAFAERTSRISNKGSGKERILLRKGKLAIAVAPSYSIP